MLLDLIDCQLHYLDLIESGRRWARYFGEDDSLAGAAKRHGDYCERMAEWLAAGKQPKLWIIQLRTLLGYSVKQRDEFAEYVRKSEAAGNPPARFEFLVSFQITEALMRGHQFAARTNAVYSGDDDNDDDDDELVLA